ncbi:chitobiase/beta-hexosaminidase C-terminal domain-containing protein, partial [Arthrospira platensis SPKY1]|nr:chitobiase/beta-hexosaminidase C-terminal domain-containing protein [Arthrospira platensis SPKY1]
GPEAMFYMLLPKLLGLAERAWSPDPAWTTAPEADRKTLREQEWSGFAHRVGQLEFTRLEQLFGGYAFRLPRPGIRIENGELWVNVETPGLYLRYTLDGSEPTADSHRWEAPVPVADGQEVQVRAFTPSGQRAGGVMRVGN